MTWWDTEGARRSGELENSEQEGGDDKRSSEGGSVGGCKGAYYESLRTVFFFGSRGLWHLMVFLSLSFRLAPSSFRSLSHRAVEAETHRDERTPPTRTEPTFKSRTIFFPAKCETAVLEPSVVVGISGEMTGMKRTHTHRDGNREPVLF